MLEDLFNGSASCGTKPEGKNRGEYKWLTRNPKLRHGVLSLLSI